MDVGSGPSADLAEEIIKKYGGRYLGLDINRNFLEQLLNSLSDSLPKDTSFSDQFLLVQGDAENLGILPKSVTISHCRFVLMNLPENLRRKIIEELVRVTQDNGKIIIIDYDWTGFASNDPEIMEFKSLVTEILQSFGTDPYHGGKLKELIENTIPGVVVEEKTFNEGNIRRYNDLVMIINSLLKRIDSIPKEKQNEFKGIIEKKKRLEELKEIFEQRSQNPNQENIPTFTPADIVAVVFSPPANSSSPEITS